MSEQIPAASNPQCWQCGEEVSGHFCPACQRIQPLAHTVDYFSFFELPRHFNLDLAQLEQQFYQLSRKFHPDFFFNAGEAEQQFSMERSARLNDAYRTLKDPLKRASYLLTLEGFKPQAGKAKTPPDLLEEVFELNEQMDEFRAAKHAPAPAATEIASLGSRVRAMEATLQARVAGLESELRENFNRWDNLSPSSEARQQLLTEVNETLNHLSYINNLIDDIEEEFND